MIVACDRVRAEDPRNPLHAQKNERGVEQAKRGGRRRRQDRRGREPTDRSPLAVGGRFLGCLRVLDRFM